MAQSRLYRNTGSDRHGCSPPLKLFGTTALAVSLAISWAPTSFGAQPDVIYFGGHFVTVNDGFDFAEAVAIDAGRIVEVGTDEHVLKLAGPETRLEDLAGKTVLPGFYDMHVHIDEIPGPDIQDWTHIDTREELADALTARARQLSEDAWVHGTLSNELWPQEKLPERWDLDQIVPDRPVVLTRGAHVMAVNSLALQIAGLTSETADPQGGTLVRNHKGELTGWLRERPAWRLIQRVTPKSSPTDDGARTAIRGVLETLLTFGITSVNIAGVRPSEMRWTQDVYERWQHRLPRMTMQLRLWPGYDANDTLALGVEKSLNELESLGVYTGFGNSRLKLGAVKLSIDGGLSGEAFWSSLAYPDRPEFYGLIRIPEEAFYPVAKRAHDLGWQLGIHAIGDAAAKMVVDNIERILAESPRENHRHYLHHVNVLPEEEVLQKMVRLDLSVSSQPNFLYSLGSFAANTLRGERLQRNTPQRSLAQRGIRLAYGSDNMPWGPLIGIWAAVTRTGFDGQVYGPEEAVSVEEAIRNYTINGAYLTFDERERGSIETGKVADMVILSEDILSIDPARIRDVVVEQTIVDGRVLYADGLLLK